MIFNVPNHIQMIRDRIKTQARRPNRGVYEIGKDYAIQRKRGAKGDPYIRIVMDVIWEERAPITMIDANAEGGYTSKSFESTFKKRNPKWIGESRWAFKFHVIEVHINE